MKFKKLILTLGSVASVAAPIAAVVSCGTSDASKFSESDMLKMSNLKSSEAHSKLQDLWLAKVLKETYGIDAQVPVSGNVPAHESTYLDILKNIDYTTAGGDKAFEDDFKRTLSWVLKNKLFGSKDALSSIYTSLKSNGPDSLFTDKTKNDLIENNLNVKIFDRKDIDTKVNDLLTGDTWKEIFYNYTEDATKGTTYNPSILGVKDLILKMMVTRQYSAISETEFNKAMPDESTKIDSKYKDETLIKKDEDYFPLIVSVMKSRLAYKTSIELAADKSRQFIVSNVDNKLTPAQAADVFDSTKSIFAVDSTDHTKPLDVLTYTTKHQTVVESIIAKKPGYTTTSSIGFQGLSSLPSGDDDLNTGSASAIKLSTKTDSRDGFIVDTKTGTKIVKQTEHVLFTDIDKTKVQVNYYTSLMPTYDTTKKTLGWETDSSKPGYTDLDILMNEAYTKDSSLYSTAIKYFTQKENPIKIKISNDWARKYYIDEGLKYIDEEK